MDKKKNTYLLRVDEEHVKFLAQLFIDKLAKESIYDRVVKKSITVLCEIIVAIAVLLLLK
jgi:hypothetical protein